VPRRLYKLHPVYKRINRAGFIGQEIVSVLNFLERAGVFSGQEIALLKEQNVRVQKKLSLAAQRNQSLINEIAAIEKNLTPEQKKQILPVLA